MFDWLIGPLVHGLSTVDRLVDQLRNILATFWSALVSFFTEQMQAAGYVAVSAGDVAWQSIQLMIALVNLGIYIPSVLLPRWLSNVISQAEGMIANAIRQLRQDIDAVITDVRNWVSQLWHDVLTEARNAITDIRNTLASVWQVLLWVRDRVTQLLTDPAILAQWIFQPLLHYAGQWAKANAVALGRWALAGAVDMTVRGASFIENVITAIF